MSEGEKRWWIWLGRRERGIGLREREGEEERGV